MSKYFKINLKTVIVFPKPDAPHSCHARTLILIIIIKQNRPVIESKQKTRIAFSIFFHRSPVGQTIFSIHGIYVDTLVYTPGAFLLPQIWPNAVIPNCIYITGSTLCNTWSGPPASPYGIRHIHRVPIIYSKRLFDGRSG